MNRRQAKKEKSKWILFLGKYIHVNPSEWNKIRRKSRYEESLFLWRKRYGACEDDAGEGTKSVTRDAVAKRVCV